MYVDVLSRDELLSVGLMVQKLALKIEIDGGRK